MGFLIGAFVLAVIALALLISGIALRKETEGFQTNVRRGRAQVVGYDRAERSDRYTLLVQIPELNDNMIYNCKSAGIRISDFPKGTVIDVLYAPRKIAGIKTVEVHLADNPPPDGTKTARGIIRTAQVVFFISAVLAIAGAVTLIF